MPDLMRRAVNRVGVAALILAGLTLVVSSVSALVLAFGYRDQFAHLKHVIYERCQQRSTYDEASQLARLGQRRLYEKLAALDRAYPVKAPGAAGLQAARVADYEDAIRELNRPLSVGAPRGCSAYK